MVLAGAELASLAIFAAAVLGSVQVPEHAMEQPQSCENDPRGYVQQPSTAMSAWAYVCVALVVWTCAIVDFVAFWHHPVKRKSVVADTHVITAMSAELAGQPEHYVAVEADFLAHISPCLLKRHWAWSLVFGASLAFQGAWGFWYHADPSLANYRVDVFAWLCDAACLTMYLGARALSFGFSNQVNPCTSLVGCRVHCSTRGRQNFSLAASAASLVALFVFLVAFGNAGGIGRLDEEDFVLAVFASLGLVQACFLVWHHYGKSLFMDTRWSLAVWGVALMLAGFAFDSYDAALCDPASYLQAHAAFHACTAAGVLLCYMALRSDAYIYEYVYAVEKRPSPRKDAHHRHTGGVLPPMPPIDDVEVDDAVLSKRSGPLVMQRSTAVRRDSPLVVVAAVGGDAERSASQRISGATPRRDSQPGDSLPRSATSSVRRDSPATAAPARVSGPPRFDSAAAAAADSAQQRPRQRSLERNIFEVSTEQRRASQPIDLVRPRPNSLERTVFQQQTQGADPTVSERERRMSLQNRGKERKLEPRPVDLEKDVFYLSGGDGRSSMASGDSAQRSRLSHHTHQSGASRHSAGHYWTCQSCHYADNELLWVHCDRCNWARPPLNQFAVAPPT